MIFESPFFPNIFTIVSYLECVLFSSNAVWGNSKRFHFLQLTRMMMLLLIGLEYAPEIVLFPNDWMVSKNHLDYSLHKIFWMPCLEENNWSFLFCFLGRCRYINSVETGRQSSMQQYITQWWIIFYQFIYRFIKMKLQEKNALSYDAIINIFDNLNDL